MPGFKKPGKVLLMSSDDNHYACLPSAQGPDAKAATDNIAIRVSNLSKCYHIYNAPHDRLKQFVIPKLSQTLSVLKRFSSSAHSPSPAFYKEFWALKDVSFEIKKGETVGIIGRNGSGKSTLLQTICGTLNPTSGTVQTNGRIAALLELGSGFNPEFTGRENVYMSAAILGLSHEEVNERFDGIAAFADIGQFLEQPVKTYSSGMFVRLAFAVNVMSTPEIMIVDEALAVGDMAFQAKCMTALTRIQDRGATVLFVSHDIGALKSLCSQGIFLERGSVEAIGTAGEVAERYERMMRVEMNAEYALTLPPAGTGSAILTNAFERQQSADISGFKISKEFEQRVSNFRYGEGGVRFTAAELLDEDLRPINSVKFNQSVFVRMHFEASIEAEIGCNYYVLDEKRNLILGAALNLVAPEPLTHVKEGGKYIVTYKTRLPLHEGIHSIQLQIVKSTGQEHTAIFLDVVDDAIIFKMSRREDARIWARVFVENEVEIKSC
jgi:lipopolysaccharide transport system ATP-binding protein